VANNNFPVGFDPEVYLMLNDDVRLSGIDPVIHYLDHGKKNVEIIEQLNKYAVSRQRTILNSIITQEQKDLVLQNIVKFWSLLGL
jgi:hypothetical protein